MCSVQETDGFQSFSLKKKTTNHHLFTPTKKPEKIAPQFVKNCSQFDMCSWFAFEINVSCTYWKQIWENSCSFVELNKMEAFYSTSLIRPNLTRKL